MFLQKEIHQEAEAEWLGEEKQCFHEEDLGKFSHNMDCLSKKTFWQRDGHLLTKIFKREKKSYCC